MRFLCSHDATPCNTPASACCDGSSARRRTDGCTSGAITRRNTCLSRRRRCVFVTLPIQLCQKWKTRVAVAASTAHAPPHHEHSHSMTCTPFAAASFNGNTVTTPSTQWLHESHTGMVAWVGAPPNMLQSTPMLLGSCVRCVLQVRQHATQVQCVTRHHNRWVVEGGAEQ